MKYVYLILFSICFSCNKRSQSFHINPNNIKEMELTIMESNKKIELKENPSLKFALIDCINNAKAEPIKFLVTYKLEIKLSDTTYIFTINGNAMNFKGKTYRCPCNLEKTFNTFFGS